MHGFGRHNGEYASGDVLRVVVLFPDQPARAGATVPGFVSAFFEVKAPVPATGLNDGSVQRLTVALESFFLVDAHMNSIGLPSPADQVDVYVK